MKQLFDFFFKGNFFVKLALLLWSLFTSLFSSAQVAKNSELYKTLKAKDSILFERTFNLCELEKLPPLINNDFEFYHDVAGEEGREAFLNSVKNNICSNKEEKIIRKLDEKSLTVFPLKKNNKLYGAIQSGKHYFLIRKNNNETPTGSALFTHLWILKDNKWKLKRVLSFNHIPIQH